MAAASGGAAWRRAAPPRRHYRDSVRALTPATLFIYQTLTAHSLPLTPAAQVSMHIEYRSKQVLLAAARGDLRRDVVLLAAQHLDSMLTRRVTRR
jgi:hypothetical protein